MSAEMFETHFNNATTTITTTTSVGTNLSKNLPPPTSNNDSAHYKECTVKILREMDYLPWDNPDNIVSAQAEAITRQVQYNVLGILFLIGGPANVINMAVFYKQGLKDRVNLCLFILSMSDLICLITFMFVFGEQMHTQFTTKERFGPISKAMYNDNIGFFAGCGYASNIIYAIIATDRCICVYNPLKFQRLMRARTMAIILAVVYVPVMGFIFIVLYRYSIGCVFDPTTGVVMTNFVEGQFYRTHKKWIDLVDTIVIGGLLPGVVLIVVTSATILTIVKLRQTMTWRSQSSSSSAAAISSKEMGLTKMLVVNSVMFMIFFSPDALNHLTRHFIPGMKSGGRYHNFFLTVLWIGDMFSFFNASLNIFVYYTMGTRYRETFWSLCGRKPKSQKTVSSVSSEIAI